MLSQFLLKVILSLFSLALLLALIVGVYWVAARVGAAMVQPGTPDPDKKVTIYILTNGVHTDIVVPVHHPVINWKEYVPVSNTRSGDSSVQFLALGWGDKGFYLQTPNWSDLKLSVAFRALTGMSTTAIHATYYHEMIVGKDCIPILISIAEYRRLVTYLKKSFQTHGEGRFINIPTDARYGNYDAFYEATGNYSLWYTCNCWANEALKVAGQKHCLWTPFKEGIFACYR